MERFISGLMYFQICTIHVEVIPKSGYEPYVLSVFFIILRVPATARPPVLNPAWLCLKSFGAWPRDSTRIAPLIKRLPTPLIFPVSLRGQRTSTVKKRVRKQRVLFAPCSEDWEVVLVNGKSCKTLKTKRKSQRRPKNPRALGPME